MGLRLDADEQVTTELALEIERTLEDYKNDDDEWF